jgi:N-acetylmuramoyl-L-alanine amidase
MSTVIKNGKHTTYNILNVKLFSVFVVILFLCESLTSINSEKGWVIVIDAGHGGKDSGAVGANNSFEKDITLAIALKTGDYIKHNIKNVTVIYTRDNDTFVELRDRASIANKNKADLFISIHANWAKSRNIQGTETYIMGPAKDRQNLEVAMKENEVIYLEDDYTTKYEDFDPKSEVSYIMFTVRQKVFQEQSTDLASRIQTEFRERAERHDREVKQAGFWVLYTTTMPSVLIETGFMTNPTEEKFLNSKQGQDYIASAIFRACNDYINKIDSKSGISAVKQQDSQPGVSETAISTAGDIKFMVQISSSLEKTEIKPGNFKGLSDVAEINTGDRYRYISGIFSDFTEATKQREKIEAVYPDAFVIAVKDNKVLPLQQAIEQKKVKQNIR